MPRPSRYVQGAQHGRLTLLEREGKDRVLCRCKTQTITQWAEELGFNRHCLYSRHKLGWSVEKILTTPTRGPA
jgi:hypothetical protein